MEFALVIIFCVNCVYIQVLHACADHQRVCVVLCTCRYTIPAYSTVNHNVVPSKALYMFYKYM